MLLKSLILHNIRSYGEQTILFQTGITLLAGDIGAGKSTILHAIEFALFGASRPDLPAESLLRKGEQKASVTLHCQIQEQDLIIHRTLQNTKQGIRQGTGYIIQNGHKTELTAVELKAKVIELLGYPQDLTSKGKNYVYRYTIYCPQEEMKQILQESAENRLNILRKMFHIERYKLVRDNILLYLKSLRKEILVLQTRCEPLVKTQEEFNTVQETLKREAQAQVFLQQKQAQYLRAFQEQEKLLQEEQRKQKQRQELLQQISLCKQSQQEQAERKEQLIAKLSKLQEQKASLLLDGSHSVETLEKEHHGLRQKIDNLQQKKQRFEGETMQLQRQIAELQQSIKQASKIKHTLQEIQATVERNQGILANREQTETAMQETETRLQKFNIQKATFKTKYKELTIRRDKFHQLVQCPTCEQSVSKEHCQSILQGVEQELIALQESLTKIHSEEQILTNSLELTKTRVKELHAIQEDQQLLLQKRASLQAQSELLGQNQHKLKDTVIQNNLLMNQFQEFMAKEFSLMEDLNKRINVLQRIKEQLLLAEQLQQQITGCLQEQEQLQKKQLITKNRLEELQVAHAQFLPGDTKMKQFEEAFTRARSHLETARINLSKQEQIVLHQKQTLQKLQEKLSVLHTSKETLQKIQAQAQWIDKTFIPLTQNIEKEIMLKIYHYCNELFSDWFEMLTEGSELTASLDSDFAPVIEQQGHHISFNYLSGGERTAASLAYRLALTKAINHVMQQMKTKELLILDEPTDGFSAEQLQRLRDCLETIGLKQILIVSHEAMMEGFVNNILTVQKVGGKSTVIQ